MIQTLTFVLSSLTGIAISIFYLRGFLLNPKVHLFYKLLSLCILIISVLFFFLGESAVDVKIEALIGVVAGAIIGIFIPSILLRMRIINAERPPVPVYTVPLDTVNENSTLKHHVFVHVIKEVFQKERITWNSPDELQKQIVAHWDTIKFSYVSSTREAFICADVNKLIGEIVTDMTSS